MKTLLTRLELFFPKSLIVEFGKIFGEEAAEKILSVFGGFTFRVPSRKEIRKMERDISIFTVLSKIPKGAQRKIAYRDIAVKYGTNVGEVRKIFKRMSALSKKAERLREQDEATSQHRRK